MSMSSLCGRLAYFYRVPRPGRQKLASLALFPAFYAGKAGRLPRMGLSKLPSGAPPGSRSRFLVLDGLPQTRHFSIKFLLESLILEPPASKGSFEASGPLPEEAA